MESSIFDEMTKAIATSTTRRQALKRIAGIVGGTALAGLAYSHQLKAHSTASCSSNWAELGCCLRVFI